MSDGAPAAPLRPPPPRDLALLAVAVCGVSTSGPLIAATAAPALAIAFWRNAFASGLLLPWALARSRAELRGLGRREWLLALAAGALLAGHFATWVPSLRFTTVASATALVSTQPVWAALIAHRGGARIPRSAWAGIALAVAGAALVTGVDVALSARALAGDLLALAGGALAAAYIAVGAEVRRSVSTTAYTTVCYVTTSAVLVVGCAAGGVRLAGYPGRAWAAILALTLAAQLLGHSLFNTVLRSTSATLVSLSILFEVPGAALIAFVWLHQRPHAAALPGIALLLAGVAVVLRSGRRSVPAVPVE